MSSRIKGPKPPSPQPRRPGRGAKKKSAKKFGKADFLKKEDLEQPEDADEVNAYVRKHTAELEEEGRRHAHIDAEQSRKEEADALEKSKAGAIGDEEGKKRGKQPQPDEEEQEEQEKEVRDNARAAEKVGLVDGIDPAQRFLGDNLADRVGDETLTDPGEMRRVLGSTMRFAQHAMLLAHESMQQGTPRRDAIAGMANVFEQSGDAKFARKALLEFGPATGILDIYPLEVIEHLLTQESGVLPDFQRGEVFPNIPRPVEMKAGEPLMVRHPISTKIRSFALKGGGHPGYTMEPTDPPGAYLLTFNSPGEYTLLFMGKTKLKRFLVDEFECTVS